MYDIVIISHLNQVLNIGLSFSYTHTVYFFCFFKRPTYSLSWDSNGTKLRDIFGAFTCQCASPLFQQVTSKLVLGSFQLPTAYQATHKPLSYVLGIRVLHYYSVNWFTLMSMINNNDGILSMRFCNYCCAYSKMLLNLIYSSFRVCSYQLSFTVALLVVLWYLKRYLVCDGYKPETNNFYGFQIINKIVFIVQL